MLIMSNTSEQQILDRLNRIEDKLDNILQHGCLKAAEHVDFKEAQKGIKERIHELEAAKNESRGKLIVLMMILGASITYILSMFFQWVGKSLPQ